MSARKYRCKINYSQTFKKPKELKSFPKTGQLTNALFLGTFFQLVKKRSFSNLPWTQKNIDLRFIDIICLLVFSNEATVLENIML